MAHITTGVKIIFFAYKSALLETSLHFLLLFFCGWMNYPQKTKQKLWQDWIWSHIHFHFYLKPHQFCWWHKENKTVTEASSTLKEANTRQSYASRFAVKVYGCFLILAAGEIKVSRVMLFIMQCSAESVHRHFWRSWFVFFLRCQWRQKICQLYVVELSLCSYVLK